MNRDDALRALDDSGSGRRAAGASSRAWDVLVVGGGATGLGVALDAQTRGYRTLLVERSDFAAATSSRSTKLIHGGVRYLPQGQLGLVRQALRERTVLLRNAPDLVRPLGLVVPVRNHLEKFYYRVGLGLYDVLARATRSPSHSPPAAAWSEHAGARPVARWPRAHSLGKDDLVRAMPNLAAERFVGGVRYHDAVFDDAGLALRLVRVFVAKGGTALNYVQVERLTHHDGRVAGAVIRDRETGNDWAVSARVVVNATGAYSDRLRTLDDPQSPPRIAVSRGTHLVLDHEFLGGSDALLVPRTADGRVLFAIPWLGKLLVGTTDVGLAAPPDDPRPSGEEIDFLLEEIAPYLHRAPTRADIRSVFAGIRPLLRARRTRPTSSARLSREHAIEVSSSGLVTIAGGKWTTYRVMAAETVDRAAEVAGLAATPSSTFALRLDDPKGPGSDVDRANPKPNPNPDPDVAVNAAPNANPDLAVNAAPNANPDLAANAGPPRDDPVTRERVIRAVREEMARTVEDVLARRSRLLILDARAAAAMADPVSRWMAEELGYGESWASEQREQFLATAETHLPE